MDFVSVLAVLFVIVCIFLVLLILIQDPKGGGGGLFGGGGGSNSILGTSGASDLLSQLTKYTAIAFGALCIILTIATKPSKKGVFDKVSGLALEQPAKEKTAEAKKAGDATPEEATPAKTDSLAPAPEEAPKK